MLLESHGAKRNFYFILAIYLVFGNLAEHYTRFHLMSVLVGAVIMFYTESDNIRLRWVWLLRISRGLVAFCFLAGLMPTNVVPFEYIKYLLYLPFVLAFIGCFILSAWHGAEESNLDERQAQP